MEVTDSGQIAHYGLVTLNTRQNERGCLGDREGRNRNARVEALVPALGYFVRSLG